MLTQQQTLDEYAKAKDALSDIVRSRNATPDQKTAARSAREELTSDFIQKNITDANERTAAFQEFITLMEQVIDDIGQSGPLPALQQLQGAVSGAKSLLSGVQGAGPAVNE